MDKTSDQADNYNMQLKDQLRSLIERDGLSISNLSKKTGVPVQTLHNWLSGVEPRSLKQVRKVASFFNVTIDLLCFGITTKKKPEIDDYQDEINAGVFEVVLRRVTRK